jgi:hypothetical protein
LEERKSFLSKIFREFRERGIDMRCEICETILSHPDDYETKCYHCGNQCDICNECHYCIRGVNPCKNKMPIDIER